MRVLLLCTLFLLLMPAATAKSNPGGEPYAGATVDPPSRDCLDCFGANAEAGTTEPDNCADCGGYAIEVGVSRDGDATTVNAQACRGGIVYICIIDETRTLPV